LSDQTRQLDTRVRFVAPENIAFEHRLAGPFSRLPAYLIDLLIRVALMFAMMFVASLIGFAVRSGGAVFMLIMLCWFVLEWFYGGLFETFWNGQTPGKRMFGLRVISVDGRPISAMQAILRNVLRAVDQQPAFAFPGLPVYSFQLGLFVAACNRRFQRLGDLAAGTIVIAERRERMAEIVLFEDPVVQAVAQRLPATFVVPQSLSRALAKYVERRPNFGPARRREISGRLGTVLCDLLNLPRKTDHDALLCALYGRAFVAKNRSSEPPRPVQMASAVESSAAEPVA